eukprot:4252556-Prymnesium_polylepis.1
MQSTHTLARCEQGRPALSMQAHTRSSTLTMYRANARVHNHGLMRHIPIAPHAVAVPCFLLEANCASRPDSAPARMHTPEALTDVARCELRRPPASQGGQHGHRRCAPLPV